MLDKETQLKGRNTFGSIDNRWHEHGSSLNRIVVTFPKSRRQVNNCCGESPCRRATAQTVTSVE